MGSATRFRPGSMGAVVLGASLLFVSACGGTTSSSGATSNASAASRSGTVTLEIGGPVTSLDPAKGSSFQDAVAAWSLYNSLVTFNQAGQIIPDLATSWTTTPDSATFHIRSGVSCSDGTKLTPAIAAASLQRYMTPSTAAPLLTEVIGAGNTAKVTSSASADTVTVALARPWSALLLGLGSPFTGIVCPNGLKNPSTLLTHSDGTGPFVSSSEVSGASYTFHQRAGYDWGPAYPGQPAGTVPKTLVLKSVVSDNTAADLQATGSLDIAAYSSNVWTRFKGSSGYSFETQPQTDTMLVFNETPGHVTANQSVRLAITQVLNRDGLNAILGNGHGVLESNLGQSTYQCYDSSLSSLIPANKPSAGSALHGMSLRIIGTTLLAGGNGTSYLLASLNQAGAHATLQNMNNEAWVTELFSGKNNWDLTILGYANLTNSLLNAAGFFTGTAPPSGENLGDVQNPAAESAYAAAGKLTGSAGCAATSSLQRSLLQRNDFVPLTAIPDTVVFGGGTAGVVVKGFAQPSSIRISG
jgi:peptide/nickel transport system substrate-binding protein